MRVLWCLLVVFTASAVPLRTSAAEAQLVAPPRWTRVPIAPRDVIGYAWVEDAAGEFLLGHGPQYLAAGSSAPIDLSLIPSGTYVCVRAWAYSTELDRRDVHGWYPPGFSSGFAMADAVCFDVPTP